MLAWEDDAELTLRTPIEEALPEPEPVAAETAYEPMPEPMFEPVAAETAYEPMPEPMPEPVAAETAYEPMPEPMHEPEPEPVAAETAYEPMPEAEPEPVAAETAYEPEPVAPWPITPVTETILHVPPHVVEAPAPVNDEALAARKAQLDLLGLDDPGVGRVAAERTNVLPYRSSGAAIHASELVAAHGRFAERPLGCLSARGCGRAQRRGRAELRIVRALAVGKRAVLPKMWHPAGPLCLIGAASRRRQVFDSPELVESLGGAAFGSPALGVGPGGVLALPPAGSVLEGADAGRRLPFPEERESVL